MIYVFSTSRDAETLIYRGNVSSVYALWELGALNGWQIFHGYCKTENTVWEYTYNTETMIRYTPCPATYARQAMDTVDKDELYILVD